MEIILLFGSSQRVLPYFASLATCCQIGYGFQGFLSRTGLIGNSYLPLTEALTHLIHSQFIWLVHLYMIIFSLNFLITVFVFLFTLQHLLGERLNIMSFARLVNQ